MKPITAEELLNVLNGRMNITTAMPHDGTVTVFEALQMAADDLNRARLPDHRFVSLAHPAQREGRE